MTDRALLFTDLVDSTATVERLGDQAAAALWAEHDRRARELLARHHGREIDRADGFFLLFDEAADAAAFALAYHAMLTSMQLSARCALHVGPVTLRENAPDDVRRGAKPIEVEGLAKPLAARVMALAGGGRTLLTGAARRSLGALPDGCETHSHGHYHLKGLEVPIEVFELCAAGETATALPPPDADKAYRVVPDGDLWLPVRTIRHTLPAERDSFVDRHADLHALAARLEAGVRLITVVGAGGTGKTRFASRHGWSHLGDWPGGVYFCDLSEARSRDGIVGAVGAALEVPLAGRDPAAQIGHAIAGRGRCLLIFDNFEQVVEHATDTVGRWLDRAGQAAFIVTSRERLQLRGEEVFALEPLPVGVDAVDLFVQRARAQAPDFVLDDANRRVVEKIIALLDGLPLAIELAAARVRVLAPAQLLERLTASLRLLDGARSVKSRQATMRAAIDWSWQLLTRPERAALAQCSVFEGSFTLDAAEAVIERSGAPDALPTIDVMQALIDKSLLQRRVDPGAAGGETLFGLLVSIRDFAGEKLDAIGPAARRAAEQRHGRHYAAAGSDEALDALYRSGAAQRRLALTRDLDNVVAACRRAVGRDDAAVAVATYLAVVEITRGQGPFALAASLGAAVAALPSLTPAQRASVDFGRGFALLRLGRLDEAREVFTAALGLARSHAVALTTCRILSGLAWLEEVQGHPQRAFELSEERLAICRSAGLTRHEGQALASVAYFVHQQGRLDAAQALFEQALAIHRSLGNEHDECGALWRYAVLLAEQGRLPQAREKFEAALEISVRLRDRVIEGEVLTNLGTLNDEIGDPQAAARCFERALALHREVGNRRWEGCAISGLGQLQLLQGHLEGAARCFETSLAIAREIGDRRMEGGDLGNLGETHLRAGRLDHARAALVAGEDVLRPIGDLVYLAMLLCSRAELEHHCGDRAAARRALTDAEAIASGAGLGPQSEVGHRIDAARRLLDGASTSAAPSHAAE